MTRSTTAIAAALALAVMLPVVQAQAQAIRTFVSLAGMDTNPCSITLPCRHFSAAIAATSVGGEVDALDPGAYGSFTISHSITIEGQGWSYVAPPNSGNAITINAPASDSINIRGVSLNGVGATGTTNGIVFNSGASLSIQNCVIRGFTGSGIVALPAGTAPILSVSDTLVSDNANAGVNVGSGGSVLTATLSRIEGNHNAYGVLVGNAGLLLLTIVDSVLDNNVTDGIFISNGDVTINRVTANGNVNGIMVDGSTAAGSTIVTIENSTVSNNVVNGITVQSASGVIPVVTVRNSVVSNNNQNGLSSNPGGVIVLARTAITGNVATGVLLNGGPIYSYGDNNVDRNLTHDVAGGSGVISPLGPK